MAHTITDEQIERLYRLLGTAMMATDISIHRPTKRAERIAGEAVDALNEARTLVWRISGKVSS